MPARGYRKAPSGSFINGEADAESAPAPSTGMGMGMGIQQFELPKSVVTRIAKASVPANITMQKEVTLALTQGATIFINFIGSIAHEFTENKGQKTISADTIFAILPDLDWGEHDTLALQKDLQKQLSAFRKADYRKKQEKLHPLLQTSANLNMAATASTNGNQDMTSDGISSAQKNTEEQPPEPLDMPTHYTVPEDDEEPFDDDDVQDGEEEEEEGDENDDEQEEEMEEQVDPRSMEDEMGQGLDFRAEENGMLEDD